METRGKVVLKNKSRSPLCKHMSTKYTNYGKLAGCVHNWVSAKKQEHYKHELQHLFGPP